MLPIFLLMGLIGVTTTSVFTFSSWSGGYGRGVELQPRLATVFHSAEDRPRSSIEFSFMSDSRLERAGHAKHPSTLLKDFTLQQSTPFFITIILGIS